MRTAQLARRIIVWTPTGAQLVALCFAVIALATDRDAPMLAAIALTAYELVRKWALERITPSCSCAVACDAALFDDDGDGEVLV